MMLIKDQHEQKARIPFMKPPLNLSSCVYLSKRSNTCGVKPVVCTQLRCVNSTSNTAYHPLTALCEVTHSSVYNSKQPKNGKCITQPLTENREGEGRRGERCKFEHLWRYQYYYPRRKEFPFTRRNLIGFYLAVFVISPLARLLMMPTQAIFILGVTVYLCTCVCPQWSIALFDKFLNLPPVARFLGIAGRMYDVVGPWSLALFFIPLVASFAVQSWLPMGVTRLLRSCFLPHLGLLYCFKRDKAREMHAEHILRRFDRSGPAVLRGARPASSKA